MSEHDRLREALQDGLNYNHSLDATRAIGRMIADAISNQDFQTSRELKTICARLDALECVAGSTPSGSDLSKFLQANAEKFRKALHDGGGPFDERSKRAMRVADKALATPLHPLEQAYIDGLLYCRNDEMSQEDLDQALKHWRTCAHTWREAMEAVWRDTQKP